MWWKKLLANDKKNGIPDQEDNTYGKAKDVRILSDFRKVSGQELMPLKECAHELSVELSLKWETIARIPMGASVR